MKADGDGDGLMGSKAVEEDEEEMEKGEERRRRRRRRVMNEGRYLAQSCTAWGKTQAGLAREDELDCRSVGLLQATTSMMCAGGTAR